MSPKTQQYIILVQLIDKNGNEVAQFRSAFGAQLELSKQQITQEADYEYLLISVFKRLEASTKED